MVLTSSAEEDTVGPPNPRPPPKASALLGLDSLPPPVGSPRSLVVLESAASTADTFAQQEAFLETVVAEAWAEFAEEDAAVKHVLLTNLTCLRRRLISECVDATIKAAVFCIRDVRLRQPGLGNKKSSELENVDAERTFENPRSATSREALRQSALSTVSADTGSLDSGHAADDKSKLAAAVPCAGELDKSQFQDQLPGIPVRSRSLQRSVLDSPRPNHAFKAPHATALEVPKLECDSDSNLSLQHPGETPRAAVTMGGRMMAVRSTTQSVPASFAPAGGSLSGRRAAVFPDKRRSAAMLLHCMSTVEYDVRNCYRSDGFAQRVARSVWFETLTILVVSANALWIGIDADHNIGTDNFGAGLLPFQVVDSLFCCFFIAEVLIRYAAFLRTRDALKDAWFVFDSFLVVLLIVDTWVFSLIFVMLESTTDVSTPMIGGTSLFRLLRLFRLSRSLRMIRLLKAIPELYMLVKGMMAAARSVCLALMLLVLIIYLFGITFRILADGYPIGERYFPSVLRSMSSLLLVGTIPDSGPFLEACTAENFAFGALGLFFVLVAALTVMNMLIGVLVEVVSTVASLESEEMDAAFVKGSLLNLLDNQSIGSDGSCALTKEEFRALCFHPATMKVLAEVDVDHVSLVDCVNFIYDAYADNGTLTFSTLFQLIMQLRGSKPATVKDVVDMRKFIFHELADLKSELASHLRKNAKHKRG
eukprot:TRINITY_DN42965_c0_g1_i1.p1 TRINITY_DN42965_c0_g1~~TRINITY_DN42965_c0_g1_i1.p1  ORF type:complete len:706 (+),score=100.17 TRINITY_DN42965_c0_g1_i1:76-2193(+)